MWETEVTSTDRRKDETVVDRRVGSRRRVETRGYGLKNELDHEGPRRLKPPLRESVEEVRRPHELELESKGRLFEDLQNFVDVSAETNDEVCKLDEVVDARLETPVCSHPRTLTTTPAPVTPGETTTGPGTLSPSREDCGRSRRDSGRSRVWNEPSRNRVSKERTSKNGN